MVLEYAIIFYSVQLL